MRLCLSRAGSAISIWALIHGLFLRSSPSAIPGGVVLVIVNSVNCLSFWSLSHVAQEGGKATRPFHIHGDTAASVIRVLRITWAKASTFCADVRAERARLSAVSFMAVRDAVGRVFSRASTTSCVAVSEVSELTSKLLSAVTPANPK